MVYPLTEQPGYILRITVPFPKSLRENGPVTPGYYNQVAAQCAGKRISKEQDIAVSMVFYGNWIARNGKRRRRDHLNYASTLIDVLCKCLQTDDSAIVHWKDLIKIHKPDGPEYIVVTVFPAKMR
jgi:hypothetical protein